MLESMFPLGVTAVTPANEVLDQTMMVDVQLPRYGVGGMNELDFNFIAANSTQGGREVRFRWRVMSGHSPAEEALAYRFETLVLRRRVETELRREGTLPPKLYLGSEEKIAASLGTNADAISRAIVHSFQRCTEYKINWKDAAGINRRLSNICGIWGYNADSGDLPDGTRTTHLWLDVNDLLHQKLTLLPARPFDYDFAGHLAPATLRAYEVLSYYVFNAIKHGWKEVRLPYRMYCLFIAQKPHANHRKAEAQIRKLHRALVENLYLEGVELAEDSATELGTESAASNNISGGREWQLNCTIGRKSFDDYRKFLHAKESRSEEIEERKALAEFYKHTGERLPYEPEEATW